MKGGRVTGKMGWAWTAAVLSVAFSARVLAAEYYADYEIGDDGGAGTSEISPWKHSPGMAGATGVAASTALQPGDTVYFKKGVVWPAAALPLTVKWSGESGNPITFTAKVDWGAGDYPVFDAENTADHCIDHERWGEDENYCVVDGLELRSPGIFEGYMHATFIGGKGHVVRNCRVSGGNIYVSGVDLVVEGNFVDLTGVPGDLGGSSQAGVALMWSSDCIVRKNEIVHFPFGGIKTGGSAGTESRNIIVEKNYIHSGGKRTTEWPSQYAVVYRNSIDCTYRYNIIDLHDTLTTDGWRGMSAWDSGGGNKLYNNVVIMPAGKGWGIHCDSQTNNTYRNNIVCNAAIGYKAAPFGYTSCGLWHF